MGLDQLLQSVMERPFITHFLFIEDHQVGRQATHPPIGVGLKHLADQADLPFLADGDQGDRQVTRDAVGPQTGLTLAVVCEASGGGAQEGVGE